MEKVSLEEQKEIMLEILGYIDLICKEHGLKYSLWGGTLLGAVRHKGYIPWDDDIDISMPRADYEKLISILEQQSEYQLINYKNEKNYTQGWSKLADLNTIDLKRKFLSTNLRHGIFVDIMPIDGLPNDTNDIKRFKKNILRIYKLVRASRFPYYAESISKKETLKRLIFGFPIYISSKFFGGKTPLITKLEKISMTYDIKNTSNCGHLLSRYRLNIGYPSNIWDELVEYEFEGKKFQGIQNSNIYLTMLYGKAYLEIPREEDRVMHTEHKFFWRKSE